MWSNAVRAPAGRRSDAVAPAVGGATAASAARTTMRHRAGPAPTPAGFRADIEGLRAVAVGLVVLDHALGWPHGGFIGVDVFFVISGFLITGLLLKEHARTGRISFVDFYRRRARRILPMSTLVLAVTLGTSTLLFFGSRVNQIVSDVLWSLGFAANWHFAALGTDYFDANRPPSPLQHYWSLAVEEQFYVVWPLLLLVALTLAGRAAANGSRGRWLGPVMGGALAVSLVWSFLETSASPTVAYFSTFSRAWELLAGALIAVLAPRLSALPHALRVVMAWGGVGAIAVGALVIGPERPFPAPWALLPVLGSMAVIASGTGASRPVPVAVLTNPVAGYLGRISYSLYLWHWPALVLMAALMPVDRLLHRLLAVVIALGLSVLSFHLVEDPIRHSRWLEPRARRAPRRPRPRLSLAAVAAGTAVVLVSGTATVALAQRYEAATPTPPPPPVAAPIASVPPIEADDPAAIVAQEIEAALGVASWPELEPSLDRVAASQPPQLNDPACVNDWDVTEQHCTYGDPSAPNRAALIGDSTAISWLPGLEAGLPEAGWSIESYGKYGCPAATTTVRSFDHPTYPECDEHRAWAFEQVELTRPDMVILGSGEGYIGYLPSGRTGDEAAQEWTSAVLHSIESVAPWTGRVVVLSSPPSAMDLRQCATRTNTPADCISPIHDDWFRTSEAEQRAVAAAQAQGIDVTYVDAHLWVCTSSNLCPGFANGMVIRSDINHLTEVYSRYLAPVLRHALVPETDGETAATPSTSLPAPASG